MPGASLSIELTGADQVNKEMSSINRRMKMLSDRSIAADAAMTLLSTTTSKFATTVNRLAKNLDNAATSMLSFAAAMSTIDPEKLDKIAGAMGAGSRRRGSGGGSGDSSGGSEGEAKAGGRYPVGRFQRYAEAVDAKLRYTTESPPDPYGFVARDLDEIYAKRNTEANEAYPRGLWAMGPQQRLEHAKRRLADYHNVISEGDMDDDPALKADLEHAVARYQAMTAVRPERWPTGPNSRLRQAQQDLARYHSRVAGGDPEDPVILADLNLRLQKAQEALNPVDKTKQFKVPKVPPLPKFPKSGASSQLNRTPLQAWLGSFGGMQVNGQILQANLPQFLSTLKSGGLSKALASPAGAQVGTAMQGLLGNLATAAGPIVATFAAVATAAVALGAAMAASAERARQFASLQTITGGTTAQTAQLREMFVGMGMDSSRMEAGAGRMTERLMTDPMAMMWAN